MRPKYKILTWSLVAATLLATIIVAIVVARADSNKLAQKNIERSAAVNSMLTAVTANTNSRVRGLAAALQDTRGQAQREEFARLSSIVSNEPGVSGIGMVLKVPESAISDYEASRGSKIKAIPGTTLRKGNTHFVVDQIFGRQASAKLVGVDVASDPARAAAISGAIESALPRATAPLDLLVGADGLILYVPIFRKGATILDYKSRREAVVGLLTIGIEGPAITAAISQALPPSTAFRISDGAELLAGSGKVTAGAPIRKIDFAGRELTIVVEPQKPASPPMWSLVLVSGTLLAALIALVIWQARRRERYANELVANRTHELEVASARMAEDARFFELTNEFVWTMDLKGNVVSINDAWSKALGWSRQDFREMTVVDLIHPDDLTVLTGRIEPLARGETVIGIPFRAKAKDGSWHWLEWSAVGAPEFNRVYGSARDITERVELEEELASERAQMHDAQIIAGLGSWNVDVRTNEMFWSDELYGLVGVEKTAETLDLSFWITVVAEEDRDDALRVVARVLKEGGEFEFEFRREAPGARNEEVRLRTRGFAERDRNGNVVRIVGTVADVTERLRHEEHLLFIANHDALTGLPNRRDFDSSFARHVANCLRYEPHGALMMIDLDGLKQINDTIGHDAGDEALKYMGDTLRDRLRAADVSGRIGGDEFAVLLPRTTRDGALMVATSIVEALASPPPRLLEMGIARLSASIGIVMLEDAPVVSADAIASIADAEMYRVKRIGHGGASVYDPKKPRATHIRDASADAA